MSDETNAVPLDPERELPPEPEAEAAVSAVAEQVRHLEEQRDMLQDRLLRAVAEADNFRKRTIREMQDARQRAAAEALRPFLAVLDSSERALQHVGADDLQALRTGFELLHRQLQDAARKAGLEPVESLHRPFDPHIHEALEMVETEAAPDGHVVEELQRGYKLNDRLVRPAMVKVARTRS